MFISVLENTLFNIKQLTYNIKQKTFLKMITVTSRRVQERNRVARERLPADERPSR